MKAARLLLRAALFALAGCALAATFGPIAWALAVAGLACGLAYDVKLKRTRFGVVPYLLADCLMRLAPVKADDALAAGRMEEQLKAAVEMLDGFAAG